MTCFHRPMGNAWIGREDIRIWRTQVGARSFCCAPTRCWGRWDRKLELRRRMTVSSTICRIQLEVEVQRIREKFVKRLIQPLMSTGYCWLSADRLSRPNKFTQIHQISRQLSKLSRNRRQPQQRRNYAIYAIAEIDVNSPCSPPAPAPALMLVIAVAMPRLLICEAILFRRELNNFDFFLVRYFFQR